MGRTFAGPIFPMEYVASLGDSKKLARPVGESLWLRYLHAPLIKKSNYLSGKGLSKPLETRRRMSLTYCWH